MYKKPNTPHTKKTGHTEAFLCRLAGPLVQPRQHISKAHRPGHPIALHHITVHVPQLLQHLVKGIFYIPGKYFSQEAFPVSYPRRRLLWQYLLHKDCFYDHGGSVAQS